MKKNKNEAAIKEDFTPKSRDKRIDELENERFVLSQKIEALMGEYVKVSGNRKLKRFCKPGFSPNDYVQKKKS